MTLEALEAAREEYQAMRTYRSPAGFTIRQEWINIARARVEALEDAVENPPPSRVKRAPREDPEARAARIHASRVRRLNAAVTRMDAYEATHPVNEHGVRTGPSIASNNYRVRDAAQDRELAAWRQYEHDTKIVRRLTGLLAKENKS